MAKSLVKVNKTDGKVVSVTKNYNSSNFYAVDSDVYDYYFLDDQEETQILKTPDTIQTNTNFIIIDGLSIGGAEGIQPTEVTGDTITQSQNSYSIPFITEQTINGNAYGTMKSGDYVFQTPYTPTVVNSYNPGGVPDVGYNPVITSIGVSGSSFVGVGCMQFKGSYLDLDANTAALTLPGWTTASYHLISGFVYLENIPSANYDPLLLSKIASISGSTWDSYKIEFRGSRSSGQFWFDFATTSDLTTSGCYNSIAISPSGGITTSTLNQWHHFAVAYENRGSSAAVSTYWNGNRTSKQSFTGSLRNSPQYSFAVGGGPNGEKPFKGYIDDLTINGGTVSNALRGFTHGTSAAVPSSHQESGFYTTYYLSGDGPVGTSLFPCDVPEKIVSTVVHQADNGVLYLSNISGTTLNALNRPSINGVCGGHAVKGASAGYIFSYGTNSCVEPLTVTHQKTLQQLKNSRSNLLETTLRYMLGVTTMRGTTASNGDFTRLYAGTTYPQSFTYLPTETNISYLRTLYDGIAVAGSTAPVIILDNDSGVPYSFVTAAFQNLYKDVVSYFSGAVSEVEVIKNDINSKSTIAAVTTAKTMTSAYSSKVASFGFGFAPLAPEQKAKRRPLVDSNEFYPVLD